MTKRKSYMHECEVRLILDQAPGQTFTQIALANIITGQLRGEALSTNAGQLIESIVAAPTYPSWALNSLQWQVNFKKLPKIETSDLLRLPGSDAGLLSKEAPETSRQLDDVND